MLSANGTIFSSDKEGVVPGLLARWYSERKVLQKNKSEATNLEEKVSGINDSWLKRLIQIVCMVLFKPVAVDSFDKRIGQSTTLFGRACKTHGRICK